MVRNLHRWLMLPSHERWLVLETYGLLWLVEVGLRTLGFAHLYRLLADRTQRDLRCPDVSVPVCELEHFGQIVDRILRHVPFQAQCLHRAFTLSILLRHRGIPVDLCLGVDLAGGIFAAHAWVEHQGMVVREPIPVREQYTLLLRATAEPSYFRPGVM